MYLVYSIIYSLGFLLMLLAFLLNRQKYASGFSQRLGNYPDFKHDGRKVIWLHCVSVGETNAARPLVDKLIEEFPDHRLIISTITKTGQELAQKIFAGKADAVFYFPFDWKFTVRRALQHFKPSLVLLMETEIWPRLIHEAKQNGAKVAIVNGRLSAKSFDRYSKVRTFMSRVLSEVNSALMQNEADADRIIGLGIDQSKVVVTGNLKFDLSETQTDSDLTEYFRERFAIDGKVPVVVAASTHDPEENWVIDALEMNAAPFRLVIAPRHPERFEGVLQAEIVPSGYSFCRRSDPVADSDKTVEIILLDSIGELRSIYALADLVFVGGSLVRHGGQSILEPAAAGVAMLTGPYTHNFAAAVEMFRSKNAILQIGGEAEATDLYWKFNQELSRLLAAPEERNELGKNALATLQENRGATAAIITNLRSLLSGN